MENAFNSLDGLYAAADLERKQVVVYMKERLTDEEMRDIVKKAGYIPGRFV
ncbi:hypothetical protein [Lacrimispora xylanisolvens]|uniref:hypothetical protein n=1 Tax=Lacrimispora xylanisolvens TaxID=384636 RepID=UPI002402795B